MMEKITTTDTLTALLAKARDAHAAIGADDATALARAMDAGDALNEAKAQVHHGEWTGALESTGIPASTARLYMQLARERARIKAAACASIRQARTLLAGTKPKTTRRRHGKGGRASSRAVDDRYEEGYQDGYRRGRADGFEHARAAQATRTNGSVPGAGLGLEAKDLRWLIKQAHPDRHDGDLRATRVTQALNDELDRARKERSS